MSPRDTRTRPRTTPSSSLGVVASRLDAALADYLSSKSDEPEDWDAVLDAWVALRKELGTFDGSELKGTHRG